MYCGKCGAQAEDGDIFCGKCGEQLSGAIVPKQASKNTIFCRSCGAEMPMTARKCPKCDTAGIMAGTNSIAAGVLAAAKHGISTYEDIAWWAFFFNIPFGIAALSIASKVEKKCAEGDLDGARMLSSLVRGIALTGIVISAVAIPVIVWCILSE